MDKLIYEGRSQVRMTKILVVLFLKFFFLARMKTISNDGATIMRLLDIVHPAAKTLVQIAKSQDEEVS